MLLAGHHQGHPLAGGQAQSVLRERNSLTIKSSVGSRVVEILIEFSSQDQRKLEEIAQLLAPKAKEIFSLDLSNIKFKTKTPRRCKLIMSDPLSMGAGDMRFSPQPPDKLKQFGELCAEQNCQFIEYEVRQRFPADSNREEKKEDPKIDEMLASFEETKAQEPPSSPFHQKISMYLSSESMSEGEILRFSSYVGTGQWTELELLLKMSPRERHLKISPDLQLDKIREKDFFSGAFLIAFIAGKLTVAQAKAVPELLDKNCLLCLLEGSMDASQIMVFASRSKHGGHNLRKLCDDNGRIALQKKLMTVEEGLCLKPEILASLLTPCGLQALDDKLLTLAQANKFAGLRPLLSERGLRVLREKAPLSIAQMMPLQKHELFWVLRGPVLQQLRTQSTTIEKALKEFEKALQEISQTEKANQRIPPGPEYPCEVCEMPGGLPNSHWHWLCPGTQEPDPDTQAILEEESQRFERTISIFKLYLFEEETGRIKFDKKSTIRTSNLGMRLREKVVYETKTGLKPLTERAVREGLATRQGGMGLAEITLQSEPIGQFVLSDKTIAWAKKDKDLKELFEPC